MRFLLIILSVSFTILQSCNNSNNVDEKKEAIKDDKEKFANTDMKKDALFAVNAADEEILKIKLGELAQTYGTTPGIKQIGKMMSDDHVQLNKELSLVAWQNKITIPAFLSDELKKKYTQLQKKDGSAFDEEYIKIMIEDHQNDLQEFNEEVNNGANEDIKAWAKKVIPVLTHHLQILDSVSNKMNDDKKKGAPQHPEKLISHSVHNFKN